MRRLDVSPSGPLRRLVLSRKMGYEAAIAGGLVEDANPRRSSHGLCERPYHRVACHRVHAEWHFRERTGSTTGGKRGVADQRAHQKDRCDQHERGVNRRDAVSYASSTGSSKPSNGPQFGLTFPVSVRSRSPLTQGTSLERVFILPV